MTAFTLDAITAKRIAGNPVITALVHNTGERAVDLSGTLDMANGPGALSAGPFVARTTATLAPGDSGEVDITLDGQVPGGPWDASITLTSGRTTESATAHIMLPQTDGSASATVVVTPTTASRSMLLPVIAIAAVLLLAAGVVIGLKRRRHGPAAVVVP